MTKPAAYVAYRYNVHATGSDQYRYLSPEGAFTSTIRKAARFASQGAAVTAVLKARKLGSITFDEAIGFSTRKL